MSNGWTPERRARQAELIRTWQPWAQSTGPVTASGKAKAAMNAYKGGHLEMMRALSRDLREVMRQQRELLDELQQGR